MNSQLQLEAPLSHNLEGVVVGKHLLTKHGVFKLEDSESLQADPGRFFLVNHDDSRIIRLNDQEELHADTKLIAMVMISDPNGNLLESYQVTNQGLKNMLSDD